MVGLNAHEAPMRVCTRRATQWYARGRISVQIPSTAAQGADAPRGPHDQRSALLNLAEKTVYAGVDACELPAFKVREQWWIMRSALAHWREEQPRGGGDGDA